MKNKETFLLLEGDGVFRLLYFNFSPLFIDCCCLTILNCVNQSGVFIVLEWAESTTATGDVYKSWTKSGRSAVGDEKLFGWRDARLPLAGVWGLSSKDTFLSVAD